MAHTLKGSAANFSAVELAQTAARLEELARGQDAGGCHEQLRGWQAQV